MPNRKTHTRITCALGIVPILAASVIGMMPTYAMFLGIMSTIPFRAFGVSIYLNPDMDIKSNIGPLGQALGLDAYQKGVKHRAGLSRSDWRGFWRNPAKIFLYSHIPLFGTLPRSLPIALLLFVLSFIIPFNEIVYIYLYWLIGMTLSDAGHVLADVAFSATKTKKGE